MGWGKYSEPINAVGQVADFIGGNLFGGWKRMGQHIASNQGTTMKEAINAGFGASKGDWDAIKWATKDDTGNEVINYLSGAQLAGGVAGLGVGYRFLSGGGAYRDKNGNTDIAGVPFV